MKPSERYRRDAEDLMKFREAFVSLVDLSRHPGWEGTSTWRQRREPVASTSGPAADAFERHAGAANINVVANWSASLMATSKITADDVLSAVDAAVARAERASEDAGQKERGVTGIVASFLRWPTTLREAIDPERVGQQKAATAIGHIAQALAIGAVASVIGAILYQLGSRLF